MNPLQAQAESLKAARQYQSAISVYRAAKETVTLAEERLVQKGEVQLSSAWQEMLNHATMRVCSCVLIWCDIIFWYRWRKNRFIQRVKIAR